MNHVSNLAGDNNFSLKKIRLIVLVGNFGQSQVQGIQKYQIGKEKVKGITTGSDNKDNSKKRYFWKDLFWFPVK